MNIQESWEKALRQTEVIRARVKGLMTFETTPLPYVFLAESAVNAGDTVVRKGSVAVERPALILPDNVPEFSGFEFEKDFALGSEYLRTFFMVRGIRFPSMRYQNVTDSLDLYEGKLSRAIEDYREQLQRSEDIETGLFIGPEDCWQFSVVVFIAHQMLRQADGDLKRLLEEYRRQKPE